MANKEGRVTFAIEAEKYAEAKHLGINLSEAARAGIEAEIAKQKKIRELLGEQ